MENKFEEVYVVIFFSHLFPFLLTLSTDHDDPLFGLKSFAIAEEKHFDIFNFKEILALQLKKLKRI